MKLKSWWNVCENENWEPHSSLNPPLLSHLLLNPVQTNREARSSWRFDCRFNMEGVTPMFELHPSGFLPPAVTRGESSPTFCRSSTTNWTLTHRSESLHISQDLISSHRFRAPNQSFMAAVEKCVQEVQWPVTQQPTEIFQAFRKTSALFY